MCFIHIPKTAGSTVTRALDELWPDGRQVGGKHDGVRNHTFAEVPAGYFVFGFVRDPLQRCRSWYSMLQRVQGQAPAADRTPFQVMACWVAGQASSFGEFVDLLAHPRPNEPIHLRRVRATQASYLYDGDEVLRADFVGKTESIGVDLGYALGKGAVALDPGRVEELAAQRHNSSAPRHLDEPIDSKTRAVIEGLYAQDYAAFGYELPR